MPYFSLRSASNAAVEVPGNTEAEVRANIAKSGQVRAAAAHINQQRIDPAH